jgi:uncharacterized protein (DUF1778 family)
MKTSNTQTARLEARLPAHVHAMLKRAAEIQGRTLTDFVVNASSEAARQTIESNDIISLSLKDQRRLQTASLIHPNPTQHSLALLLSIVNCLAVSDSTFSA